MTASPAPVVVTLEVVAGVVSAGVVVAPDPVAVAAATPVASVSSGAWVAPDPIAASLTAPSPTVVSVTRVSPDPVVITLVVPTPTLGGVIIAYPDPVTLSTSIVGPVVSAAAAVDVLTAGWIRDDVTADQVAMWFWLQPDLNDDGIETLALAAAESLRVGNRKRAIRLARATERLAELQGGSDVGLVVEKVAALKAFLFGPQRVGR